MTIQEDYMGSEYVNNSWQERRTLNSYALGARGIDRQRTTTYINDQMTANEVTYPVYDGHGNMVASLSRSGSNAAVVSGDRVFDVWGGVRTGTATTMGYCANLGHKTDLESGLIYMRARYYEPSTGRFISEDPSRDGGNWFSYANNDPSNHTDFSGESIEGIQALIALFFQYFSLWNLYEIPNLPTAEAQAQAWERYEQFSDANPFEKSEFIESGESLLEVDQSLSETAMELILDPETPECIEALVEVTFEITVEVIE